MSGAVANRAPVSGRPAAVASARAQAARSIWRLRRRPSLTIRTEAIDRRVKTAGRFQRPAPDRVLMLAVPGRRQVLMHRLDDNRAFADRGSDALDRAATDVADRENTGEAG